jgi:putative membrane protein
MIIYNTKNWANSLWKIALSFNLKKGGNYTYLLISQCVIAAYVSIITIIELEVHDLNIHVEPMFFSLVGLIISLILVFRLNSAYDKWWEGRKQWGALVNHCRTMASNFHSVLPLEDKESRIYLAGQISNFPFTLAAHLRKQRDFKEIKEVDAHLTSELIKSSNPPHLIATRIFIKMENLYKEDKLSNYDKLNIKPQIQALIDVLGACERITSTPIPFSHSSFIKSFIVIYILVLPFGLIDTFHYFAIMASTLISYALVGVELISEEIEDPFGEDSNDLPLTLLSNKIKQSAYATFGLKCKVDLQESKTNTNKIKIVN